MIVARHFSGGYAEGTMRVPGARMKKISGSCAAVSVVPTGRNVCEGYAAINRWATIGRPFGAFVRGRPHDPDGSDALRSNALMSIRNFLMLRLFWSHIVPDVGPAHPEDHVFCDVGGMVSYSFEIACHQ